VLAAGRDLLAAQTCPPRPDGNDDEVVVKDVGSGGVRPSPAQIRSSLEWIRHGGGRIRRGRSRIGDGPHPLPAAAALEAKSSRRWRRAVHYARAGMEAEQLGGARGGRSTTGRRFERLGRTPRKGNCVSWEVRCISRIGSDPVFYWVVVVSSSLLQVISR